MLDRTILLPTVLTCFFAVCCLAVQPAALHDFQRQQLTDTYYSEGANAGDLNGDQIADVVYGPYWFAGPDFQTKHEIYKPVPQNVEGYADNFFSWIYDFNQDGKNDIFVVGFPGTPAFVYENPGKDGFDQHWKKHQVFDWVSNESPHFTNLVGDQKPELVCTRNGFFGYVTIEAGLGEWTFHRISDRVATERFGHGLGVGDVDGDGRLDVIVQNGWFRQPEELVEGKVWDFQRVDFAPAGGAEMYAYDVDGDGDNDVITSLAAHEFGLSWFEQFEQDGQRLFKEHLIMGSRPQDNRYGVLFSELHSVNLADINGDGLQDIVTGKTYWSHHRQSPMWDAGAVVYWFELKRTDDGVDWIPHKADGNSGIGRQLIVTDVNNDQLPDMVLGGMKGAHVLLHSRRTVSASEFQAKQPKPFSEFQPTSPVIKGKPSKLDSTSGRVPGAIELENAKVLSSSGNVGSQNMAGFGGGTWSGNQQLFWTGAQPGDQMVLAFEVPKTARYKIATVFTKAVDYAVIRVGVDDKPLSDPIDLFHKTVTNSDEIEVGSLELEAGSHRLVVQIDGANPQAVKAYMVGLDYLKLTEAN